MESDKGKDILVIIIIILVGLGSFGLGRLSKNTQNSGIKIQYPNKEANKANVIESINQIADIENLEQNSSSKTFFASSRGSKYYSINCSAGKTIKEENKIFFSSSTEAEEAGFELSSACK